MMEKLHLFGINAKNRNHITSHPSTAHCVRWTVFKSRFCGFAAQKYSTKLQLKNCRLARRYEGRNKIVKIVAFVFLILLGGCASNAPKETSQEKKFEVRTVQKEFTPHIWSDHKILKVSTEVCAQKSTEILESLGFNQIVKNRSYVYGNYSNNRAVIKCTTVGESTFVYAAVAGPKVEIVEKLRNEIVWQL